MVIDGVAVGVRVAGNVEPFEGQPLRRPRLGQERVDESLEGARILVCEKGVDLDQGWRQPGQVQSDPANESFLAGRTGRRETLFFEAHVNEGVHRMGLIALPLWQLGPGRRRESPVTRVGRALADPAAQDLDLFCRHRILRLEGRHDVVLVFGRHPVGELALLQVAGHDDRASPALT